MGQCPQKVKNAECLKLNCFKVKTSIAADRAMPLSVVTLKCCVFLLKNTKRLVLKLSPPDFFVFAGEIQEII